MSDNISNVHIAQENNGEDDHFSRVKLFWENKIRQALDEKYRLANNLKQKYKNDARKTIQKDDCYTQIRNYFENNLHLVNENGIFNSRINESFAGILESDPPRSISAKNSPNGSRIASFAVNENSYYNQPNNIFKKNNKKVSTNEMSRSVSGKISRFKSQPNLMIEINQNNPTRSALEHPSQNQYDNLIYENLGFDKSNDNTIPKSESSKNLVMKRIARFNSQPNLTGGIYQNDLAEPFQENESVYHDDYPIYESLDDIYEKNNSKHLNNDMSQSFDISLTYKNEGGGQDLLSRTEFDLEKKIEDVLERKMNGESRVETDPFFRYKDPSNRISLYISDEDFDREVNARVDRMLSTKYLKMNNFSKNVVSDINTESDDDLDEEFVAHIEALMKKRTENEKNADLEQRLSKNELDISQHESHPEKRMFGKFKKRNDEIEIEDDSCYNKSNILNLQKEILGIRNPAKKNKGIFNRIFKKWKQ